MEMLLWLVVVLAWVVIGFGCWVGYQLLGQNGRLLLRVEALERHLGELEGLTLPASVGPAPPDGGDALADQPWPDGQADHPPGLPVGTVLHDFELPDLDGRQHLRSDWLGERLLMAFVSPACPHSRALVRDLAALGPAGPPAGPRLLLIGTGDPAESRRLLAETGLQCTLLLQEEMEVGELFEVTATPLAYLVDEDGKTASPLVAGRAAILGLAVAWPPGDADPPLVDPPSPALVEATTTPAPVNGARYQGGLAIGSPAPSFRLPGLEGTDVSLDAYPGRRVLLVFTDPICPPCDAIVPNLERLYRSDSGPGVMLIARGDRDANRAWAAEHGLTAPIGLQQRWDVSRQYGLLATPIAFLVDERGLIAAPVALGADAILALAAREYARAG